MLFLVSLVALFTLFFPEVVKVFVKYQPYLIKKHSCICSVMSADEHNTEETGVSKTKLTSIASLSFVMLFAVGVSASGGLDTVEEIVSPDLQATSQVSASGDSTENIFFDNPVTIYVNGEKMVTTTNALMEGEEIIRRQLATGPDSTTWNYIALGNGATPTDSSSSLDQEYSSTGLSPQSATLNTVGDGTDGVEWNLSTTFTATGDADVSTTAVRVDPNSGIASEYTHLAGTGFGRTIPLQADDEITVTWNFDVD